MNFGHGASGRYACPSTKSEPVAEYSIVFRLSAPMAFEDALMTAAASSAPAPDSDATSHATAAKTDRPLRFIVERERTGITSTS